MSIDVSSHARADEFVKPLCEMDIDPLRVKNISVAFAKYAWALTHDVKIDLDVPLDPRDE